jgi:hypothetical protein
MLPNYNRNLFYLYVFLFLFIFFSCKTSFKPEKPEASYEPKPRIYDKQLSFFNLPIEIATSDIEKKINEYVKGTLYEDNSFDDNNEDGLKCLVKKHSDIKLDALQNRIKITVPLDVSGKYKAMGITVDFKGILSASYVTAITLEDDWKMRTVTKSAGHEWIKKPTIDLYLFELPVTTIADAAIKGQQTYISREIDKAINEYVDLKEYAKEYLTPLYEPIQVSETYKTWLKIQPVEVLVTQLNAANKKIKFGMGLKAYTETIIGSKPLPADKAKVPPMKIVEVLNDDFHIGLAALVSYQDAAKLLHEQFVVTPYTYTDGKKSVTVTAIDLWGQKNKLVLSLGLKGSVKGMIYLTGVPYYEAKSRNIKMSETDFHLDTKNKLLKSANWLLHGTFAKKIEQYLYFEIGKELDAAKKECQSYFNNYELSKGVFLNGKLNEIETSKIFLLEDAIVTIVDVKGKASVKVEGM